MFSLVEVVEEGPVIVDVDGAEHGIIGPIAVIEHRAPMNSVYCRILLKPCLHLTCSERFEMSLN